MRVKNKKVYYLKKRTVIVDEDGGQYASFSETPIEINAYIYPASGKMQAEIYGERLKYILNMLHDENAEIVEGDCIVYNNSNYIVISIKNYSWFHNRNIIHIFVCILSWLSISPYTNKSHYSICRFGLEIY